MTQEDKELLLQDLSARLPYGVKVQHQHQDYLNEVQTIEHISRQYGEIETESVLGFVDDFKPYLRPMSSMTEEESAELSNIISGWFDKELFYLTEEPFLEYALSRINYSINPLLFDWLNKNHFDYRGLIPKKLAIAVTKENNPYEN